MKSNTTIIALTFIIALGLGYLVGMNSAGMEDTAKDMQDAIVMMKKQSASIEKMGEMMKSSGRVVQEFAVKYNDNEMMSQGKDLEAVGGQYTKENADEVGSSGSMNRMMSN